MKCIYCKKETDQERVFGLAEGHGLGVCASACRWCRGVHGCDGGGGCMDGEVIDCTPKFKMAVGRYHDKRYDVKFFDELEPALLWQKRMGSRYMVGVAASMPQVHRIATQLAMDGRIEFSYRGIRFSSSWKNNIIDFSCRLWPIPLSDVAKAMLKAFE